MSVQQQCKSCFRRQALSHKNCLNCGQLLKGNRQYLVMYRNLGKQKFNYFRDLRTARYKDHEIKNAIAREETIEINKNRSTTLSNLADWYLSKPSTKRKKSYQRDKDFFVHLLRILGENVIVADLNLDILEDYQEIRLNEPSTSRLGHNVAPATVDKELQCLHAALKKAYLSDRITSIPIKYIPQLKIDNSRERILDYETEILPIVNSLPNHLAKMALTSYWIGMREGELTNLCWENLNWSDRTIVLNAKETKESKKKTIPLLQPTLEIFESLYVNRPKISERVFLRNNRPFQWDGGCRHHWNRAKAEANVDNANFHDLRHSCITRLVVEGYPLSFIMSMTGHSQFKTHMRYANLNSEQMWQIVKNLN